MGDANHNHAFDVSLIEAKIINVRMKASPGESTSQQTVKENYCTRLPIHPCQLRQHQAVVGTRESNKKGQLWTSPCEFSCAGNCLFMGPFEEGTKGEVQPYQLFFLVRYGSLMLTRSSVSVTPFRLGYCYTQEFVHRVSYRSRTHKVATRRSYLFCIFSVDPFGLSPSGR